MARGVHSEFTDNQGRYRTKSLFIEMINKEQLAAGFEPMYTLKAHPKYMDLHLMYLEEADPTEYNFALRAFGSWEHFKHMRTLSWFLVYLNQWREELEVKLRAEGVKALRKTAKTEGARGISAAKFLAEKGWEPKKRGRPSQEEIERERQIQARMQEDLQDDASRLLN